MYEVAFHVSIYWPLLHIKYEFFEKSLELWLQISKQIFSVGLVNGSFHSKMFLIFENMTNRIVAVFILRLRTNTTSVFN